MGCAGLGSLMQIVAACVLALPALILWGWLMEEALRAASQCPNGCWCDPGRSVVDCSNVTMDDLPSDIHYTTRNDVREFIFDHNPSISTLRKFAFHDAGLFSVEFLSVSHCNRLMEVEPGAFWGVSGLRFLHLYHNRIHDLYPGVFANLTKLIDLDLSHNEIHYLFLGLFRDLISLEHINLEFNSLYALKADMLMGLDKLKNLWLGGNYFDHIPLDLFKHTKQLELLDLSNSSRLVVPTDRPFLKLATLDTLYLQHCDLLSVTRETFRGTPHIRKLNLSGNYLTTVGIDVLEALPSLNTLYLGSNPLRCTCALRAMWRLIRHRNITTSYEHDVPRCAQPEIVYGLWWGVLEKSDCDAGGAINFREDFREVVPEFVTLEAHLYDYRRFLKIVQAPVFGILFTIGAAGNVGVIIVIGCNRRMRSLSSNAYIFNLAVGDLLTLFAFLPFHHSVIPLDPWDWGEFACKFSVFFRQMCIGASAFSVAVLSLQRYLATSPGSASTAMTSRRATGTAILGLWLLAAFCSLPSGFSVHVSSHRICSLHSAEYYRVVTVFYLLVFCAMPLIIVAWMYVRTARRLVENARRMESTASAPSAAESRKVARACKTLAKIVLGLALSFFVSFVPYHVLWLVLVWQLVNYEFEVVYVLFAHTILLVLNACFNPIALCFSSLTYRRLFKHYLIDSWCKHLRRGQTSNSALASNTVGEDKSSDLPSEEHEETNTAVVRYTRRMTAEEVLL